MQPLHAAALPNCPIARASQTLTPSVLKGRACYIKLCRQLHGHGQFTSGTHFNHPSRAHTSLQASSGWLARLRPARPARCLPHLPAIMQRLMRCSPLSVTSPMPGLRSANWKPAAVTRYSCLACPPHALYLAHDRHQMDPKTRCHATGGQQPCSPPAGSITASNPASNTCGQSYSHVPASQTNTKCNTPVQV